LGNDNLEIVEPVSKPNQIAKTNYLNIEGTYKSTQVFKPVFRKKMFVVFPEKCFGSYFRQHKKDQN
jgi:hypothetical protein